jgi:hypothetical protein
MVDFTSSRAFRVAGPKAFAEAGITYDDVAEIATSRAAISALNARLWEPDRAGWCGQCGPPPTVAG